MKNINNNKIDDGYLDLSNSFMNEEMINEVKQEESIKAKQICEPLSNNNLDNKVDKKSKKKRTNGLIVALVFISLISLATSGYVVYDNQILKRQIDNPELIYSGDWDCFTERCVGYMTINEWSKDNCNDALTECNINYQGQDIVLPFEQIKLPPEHELLCKEYVCSTEIPIRRYSDE